ncbi:hypothetical protein WA026_003457 [Henosepilachna vigintioctopunctata]|uniref:V-type proton ATPase subunit F n=1 Tax=Henosepilachna vigintioctopunctata TaxID=420089 RepID=A0AAW1TIE8_9CUCU
MEQSRSVHSIAEQYTEGHLIALVGEEDTIVGFLLAGIGERTGKEVNFAVVGHEATEEEIMSHIERFIVREDIAIILVTFEAAAKIKQFLVHYHSFLPVIMEIPSKYHGYNPDEDEIMARLINAFGSSSDEHLNTLTK